MILVLMGVTGSGKTTIGKLLAAETGWRFADADDFHSEATKAKMHAGIPLTDEERKNHYMNPDLLQSQLDTLEVTPDLMRVCAEGPPRKIVEEILDKILTVEGKTTV